MHTFKAVTEKKIWRGVQTLTPITALHALCYQLLYCLGGANKKSGSVLKLLNYTLITIRVQMSNMQIL